MRVKTVHNACAWKFAHITAAVLFALISGLHAPVPTERRCVRSAAKRVDSAQLLNATSTQRGIVSCGGGVAELTLS